MKENVTGTIDHRTNIYRDKKTSKNILPGLDPEWVENHGVKDTF